MAINKVIYNSKVLIDLTSDTVSADKLLKGVKAHDKSGNIITGTYESTYAIITGGTTLVVSGSISNNKAILNTGSIVNGILKF